eukprot:2116970-Lingulodinium_polyedra.AAC.1
MGRGKGGDRGRLRALTAKRGQKWDLAEQVSDEVGVTYTDRNGQRRFPEQEKDMFVERVLARYRAVMGTRVQ